jgi:hypothetical protein
MAEMTFTEMVRRVVERFAPFLWLAVLLAMLIVAAFWLLSGAVAREERALVDEDPANYPQKPSDGRPATVYYFYADWCSVCTESQPVWDRFVAAMDGRAVNGYRVGCVTVDVTDADNKRNGVNEALAQQYNLDSFPTVKIVVNNKVVMMNASVADDTLRSFVENCTKRAAAEENRR